MTLIGCLCVDFGFWIRDFSFCVLHAKRSALSLTSPTHLRLFGKKTVVVVGEQAAGGTVNGQA